MSALRVKPIYMLGELSEAMGISRRRVLRLLKAAGVHTEVLNHQRVIYASDIQARLPRLWQSFVMCDLKATAQVKG
jgi:predicted DNA-binding protein (UPF0251 family)